MKGQKKGKKLMQKNTSDITRNVLMGLGFLAIAGSLATGGVFLAKYLKSSDQEASTTTSTTSTASKSVTASTASSLDETVTTTPSLTVSKAAISITVKDGSFPTDSFVGTLSGVGASASDEQKQLLITSDDTELDSWLKIWCTRSGSDVQLASPYAFASGETVHLQPLKVPTVQQEGWYKISLLVKSTAFSLEKYVDVNIYSAA